MEATMNLTKPKHRNYYFDNLKLLLITLVVIGHTVEPLINSQTNMKILYTFIYSFHMPLFVFISGYFSKSITNSKKFFLKINNIILSYITFQFMYYLFNIYILKTENFKFTLVYPYWIMWYLVSFFTWSLILPYFSKIKHPIIIAFVISILSGYDNNIGYYLSLSRTITFFPYFLIGYFCQKSHIKNIKRHVKKKYAFLGLFIIFLGIYLLNDRIDYRWFYGSFSYSQLNSANYPEYMIRIFTYILAIPISIFILALTPNKNLFCTKLGSRTMTVYAFHGFIIKLLVEYNFFNYINYFMDEIFIIILALFIVILLSSKFTDKLTKIIIHPKHFSNLMSS